VLEKILRHCGLWHPSAPRAVDGFVHAPDGASDGQTASCDKPRGTDLRGHRHLSGALLILTDGGPLRASRRLRQAKCPQDPDVSGRLRGSPLVGSHFEDTETQERNVSHLEHLETLPWLTSETGGGNLCVAEVMSASLEKAETNAGNARLTAASF
jgi:hypothetical protein